MVTKGNITEQAGVVSRTLWTEGVLHGNPEIVAEKHAGAYHSVVEKYGLILEATWMIGNSPNSDINPALEAGLHAVFVPHRNTWMLERGELRIAKADSRLLQVESFATNCGSISDLGR